MSKFKAGEHVRVTDPKSYVFDQVGVICRLHSGDHSRWIVDFDGALWGCAESTLTLADPDVHTVLDQMDAESADPVSAPSHYRSHPSGIETITITRHESFLRGNILKYVLRAPYKGSEIEDLKKAAQYLQWEIERAEAAQ